MAATGNVKISELTNHSNVDGREVLPISWEQTPGGGYESYKVSFDSLKSYVGQSLDITGNTGLAARVTSYGKEISYLKRDLGQYAGGLDGNYCSNHTVNLTVGTQNYAINESGVATAKSGYSISTKVAVKEGTLYLLTLSADMPTDVSLFAKRHVHVYYPITGYQDVTTTLEDGTTVTVREPIYGDATEQVTYEPLSTHYMSMAAGGYGHPSSLMVVFYATEDEEIVISAPTSDISGKKFYATHYAIFSEIADKFIGNNTDISRVIAEAIAQLEGRVEACEGNVGSIGYATALQIDNMKMPKYRGGEMMIITDHAPKSVATPTEPADVPNHPGQIWIDTANQNVYFAVSAGTFAGWKNVTLS